MVVHILGSLPVDLDGILRKQIEHQLMNLALLNKYEEQIARKRKTAKDNACKIIDGNPYPNSR